MKRKTKEKKNNLRRILRKVMLSFCGLFVLLIVAGYNYPSDEKQIKTQMEEVLSVSSSGSEKEIVALQSDEWKAPPEAETLKNPLSNDADAGALGKKTYDNMCWLCHGNSGKGDGPAGVNLDPKPKDHTGKELQQQSDGTLFWKITNGRGAMPPYKETLSKEERWQLVKYIRVLGSQNKE